MQIQDKKRAALQTVSTKPTITPTALPVVKSQPTVADSKSLFTQATKSQFAPATASAEKVLENKLAIKEAKTEKTSGLSQLFGGRSLMDVVKSTLSGLPKFELPKISLPQINLPKISLPKIELPKAKFPPLSEPLKSKILGPPFPTTHEARSAEDKRVVEKLAEPLSKLSPAQAKIFDQIRKMGMSDTDIFRGSHAIAKDGGKLYDEWSKQGAIPRTSSHYVDVRTQQYEIPFKGMGALLFGKDKNGNTWFQMEAHSDTQEKTMHKLDYIKHLISGNQNIGPAGYSPHSEKEGQELRFEYLG